jgi:isopentenyl diphosphate isomerase/L-lactate dehydrogenase-like FMN-dependent dehydrogenase
MKPKRLTRRGMLAVSGSVLAAAQVPAAHKLIGEPAGRIAPSDELVNAYEFGETAQRTLSSLVYAEIAPDDRRAMDRITFNPRMMVNTTKLNLSSQLLGADLFTPILIGPASEQNRYHPEGELAMARGAAQAQTGMVVSDRSSYPIEKIAAETKQPLWYQVFLDPDASAVHERIDRAVQAGCKVVVITAGVVDGSDSGPAAAPTMVDWSQVERLRKGISVPVVVKGILTVEHARMAVSSGVAGMVVSNHERRLVPHPESGIEALPAIAQVVAGKVPILVDGGFCRGSDVLKALALGAQAVLICRAALWALAAYGAKGVHDELGLIQNELARDMMMCGLVNLQAIARTAVTIHRR